MNNNNYKALDTNCGNLQYIDQIVVQQEIHRVGYTHPLHNINIHNTHLRQLLHVGSKSSSSKAEASMNIVDAAAGATVVVGSTGTANESQI